MRYARLTILIVMFLLFCKPVDIDNDISVIEFSKIIIIHQLKVTSEYFDDEIFLLRFPTIYDLYDKDLMIDEIFSEQYWISTEDVVPDVPHELLRAGLGDLFHYIYILPKEDNNEFYVITNYTKLLGPYYELQRFEKGNLIELLNQNRNSKIPSINYEVVCRFWHREPVNYELGDGVLNIYIGDEIKRD